MDGIDGLAGGQALVAGLAWMATGWATDQFAPAAVGAALAGAAFGFLLHNWSPARTFMGDVGSAFLGFVLATLPLLATPRRAFAVPAVLIVWPFVFDTAVTLLRRLSRRENVFAAHRTHLYQRLTAERLVARTGRRALHGARGRRRRNRRSHRPERASGLARHRRRRGRRAVVVGIRRRPRAPAGRSAPDVIASALLVVAAAAPLVSRRLTGDLFSPAAVLVSAWCGTLGLLALNTCCPIVPSRRGRRR